MREGFPNFPPVGQSLAAEDPLSPKAKCVQVELSVGTTREAKGEKREGLKVPQWRLEF